MLSADEIPELAQQRESAAELFSKFCARANLHESVGVFLATIFCSLEQLAAAVDNTTMKTDIIDKITFPAGVEPLAQLGNLRMAVESVRRQETMRHHKLEKEKERTSMDIDDMLPRGELDRPTSSCH